ncbi:MAG: glycosyltransferase family 61 protein [Deltaproteobacteria bacterium]|nr:glycosyltransferase family 61 protein [Deltaproteobacteria bacterium]
MSGSRALSESVIYPAVTLAPLGTSSQPSVRVAAEEIRRGAYVFLDGIYSEYFWHWMLEYLPRILIAEIAGFQGSFVIRNDAPPFVKESLALLEIAPDRIVERGDEPWLVESAFIPEVITGTKGHGRQDISLFPELLLELRSLLLAGAGLPTEPIGVSRTFVSRRHATRGRKITNELELEKLCARYGFETVIFDELTLREQLEVASSSAVLLGPHGAGMLHALFMPEKSSIIELCSPNFVPDTNAAIHAVLHQRHLVVAGVPREELLVGEPNLADIEADLHATEQTLELVCRGE